MAGDCGSDGLCRIPFVVRTVQPVLEELGPEYEEAAETLGATRWQSFCKVVLPELSPALVRRAWRCRLPVVLVNLASWFSPEISRGRRK